MSGAAHKWNWMMDFCIKNGLPPAQDWAWILAESEYNKRAPQNTMEGVALQPATAAAQNTAEH